MLLERDPPRLHARHLVVDLATCLAQHLPEGEALVLFLQRRDAFVGGSDGLAVLGDDRAQLLLVGGLGLLADLGHGLAGVHVRPAVDPCAASAVRAEQRHGGEQERGDDGPHRHDYRPWPAIA